MSSLVTNIVLSDIQYPVFYIGTSKPEESGNILYYMYKYIIDEEKERISLAIIDDKTVEGDTLAKRRLLLLSQGVKLKPLKKAIFFLGDLIKFSNPTKWFIDSTGKVFRHVKSTRAKLVFKKIEKLIPIPSGGAIVQVEGIPSRFKLLFFPSPGSMYAGLLKLNNSYILYGMYDTVPDRRTWRMI